MVSTVDRTTADRLRQEVCADAITRLGRARTTLDRIMSEQEPLEPGDLAYLAQLADAIAELPDRDR